MKKHPTSVKPSACERNPQCRRSFWAFVITMSLFITACAAITALTIVNEPQYVRVSSEPRTAAPVCESIPRLNLNTATSEELQTLPGIGEVRAADIIAYREERGRFAEIDELLEVRGIGEATLANLRDLIYIG
jgi:comEA protein